MHDLIRGDDDEQNSLSLWFQSWLEKGLLTHTSSQRSKILFELNAFGGC